MVSADNVAGGHVWTRDLPLGYGDSSFARREMTLGAFFGALAPQARYAPGTFHLEGVTSGTTNKRGRVLLAGRDGTRSDWTGPDRTRDVGREMVNAMLAYATEERVLRLRTESVRDLVSKSGCEEPVIIRTDDRVAGLSVCLYVYLTEMMAIAIGEDGTLISQDAQRGNSGGKKNLGLGRRRTSGQLQQPGLASLVQVPLLHNATGR